MATRRPPEIPPAQWRGYSTSYKQRLSSFYSKHPGASIQQARGHPKAEHVVRATRLNARIDALAARQAYRASGRGGKSADELAAIFRERIAERGESWLGRLERKLLQLNREWVSRGRPFNYQRNAMHTQLDVEAEDFDLDDDDLYYH